MAFNAFGTGISFGLYGRGELFLMTAIIIFYYLMPSIRFDLYEQVYFEFGKVL